jgi:tRNA (guanine37-N1)-methyltransferase
MDVPPVLLSGNHEEIRLWRRREALKKTLEVRPDLIDSTRLSDRDKEMLLELSSEEDKSE